MSIELNSIAILNSQGFGYRCIINRISKNGAINSFKKVDSSERSGTL